MEGRVEPVYEADVLLAAELTDTLDRLSARDLLHLAVMNRLGVLRIVTADRAFDGVPDIQRLDPMDVGVWRDSLRGTRSPQVPQT